MGAIDTTPRDITERPHMFSILRYSVYVWKSSHVKRNYLI